MPDDEGYRRYIEAAAALGQITKARAEELVREFMSERGHAQRPEAQQWVDDMIQVVRTEVTNQLNSMGLDAEDLARQAAELLRRSVEMGRRASGGWAPWERGPEGGGPEEDAAEEPGQEEARARARAGRELEAEPLKKVKGAKKAAVAKKAAGKADRAGKVAKAGKKAPSAKKASKKAEPVKKVTGAKKAAKAAKAAKGGAKKGR